VELLFQKNKLRLMRKAQLTYRQDRDTNRF